MEITKDLSEGSYVGQSSKLNIQLALRYRFTEAFRACGTQRNGVFETGKKYPDRRDRKLNKPRVLEAVGAFLEEVHEYYFIALTNSMPNADVWGEKDEFLPPLNTPSPHTLWQRFGSLTYGDLLDAGVVDEQEGYFQQAWEVMMMTRPERVPAQPADEKQQTSFN